MSTPAHMAHAPAAPAKPREFRLDIQGLRGLSVLLVVLFHAGLGVSGGFVGVDVFFAISGFVITRGLITETERTGTVDIKRFYARRVRRLLPAVGGMLTVVGLACVLLLSPAFPQPQALQTGLAAAFSVSNLFLWKEGGGYFSPVDEQNPFVHTWSLGVEEQFYLCFPLVMFLSFRYGPRLLSSGRRAFVVLVAATALLSFALSVLLTYDIAGFAELVPRGKRFAFYGPVTRVWEFAAGVLMAVWAPRPRSALLASSLCALGVALVLWASFGLTGTTPFPGAAALLPVAGAVLIFAGNRGPVAAALANPVLVWLGDRSYSWYLWHWPFIVLLPIALPGVEHLEPLAAAVSLWPSMASYAVLEQRFRLRRGVTPSVSAPRLAGVTAGIPLLLLSGSLAGSYWGWGLDRHVELLEPTLSQQHFCFEVGTDLDDCRFGKRDTARGTVMLVGDSHADSISSALVPAAEEAGYEVIVHTHLSCPFVTMELPFAEECLARQKHTFELVKELQPDILFMANRSPTALIDIQGTGEGTEVFAPPQPKALARWREGLTRTFADVEPYVGGVLLFSVVPYFEVADFDGALPTLARPDGRYPQKALETIQASRRPILEAESQAAASMPELVTLFDPLPHLCDAEGCTIRGNDGLFHYRDDNHLTARRSRALARPLASLLDAWQSDPAARSADAERSAKPSAKPSAEPPPVRTRVDGEVL